MRDDVSLNVIKDYADFHSKGLIVTFHKVNFLHISYQSANLQHASGQLTSDLQTFRLSFCLGKRQSRITKRQICLVLCLTVVHSSHPMPVSRPYTKAYMV